MKNWDYWVLGIMGIYFVGILGFMLFLDFITPILEHLTEEAAQCHVEIKMLYRAASMLIGGVILKRLIRFGYTLQKRVANQNTYPVLLPTLPKRKRTRRIKWDTDT